MSPWQNAGTCNVFAWGLNHQTAPVSVREQFACAESDLPDIVSDARLFLPAEEVVVLSTCNRTEWYAVGEGLSARAIQRFMCASKPGAADDWQAHAYVYSQEEAVRHLFLVAAGMDSLILGEPQIVGQVKRAYALAEKGGGVGRILSRLFQQAFSVAKKVRSRTEIGAHAVSWAGAGCYAVKQVFADFSDKKVLCIGAGETIVTMVRHLHKQGIRQWLFANRTSEKSVHLAEHWGGQWCDLQDIPSHIADCDWVLSATASPLPLLGKGLFERALRERKHRPVCVLDLAVPRDIEKEVGELPDVYYFDIDYLQSLIAHHQSVRLSESEKAQWIVDEALTQFGEWLVTQAAVPHIRACRDAVHDVQQAMQERAERWLARGIEPEAVVARILHDFSQKLLHHPTVAMREAAANGRDDMLEWAQQLWQSRRA